MTTDNVTPVTLARLQQLFDAYGVEPEHWPAHEREAALALLAASPDARALRADAAWLDAALAATTPQSEPSTELRRRILDEITTTRTRRERLRKFFGQLWQELGGLRIAGPAFAASLVLGWGLAYLAPPSTTTGLNEDDLLIVALLADPSSDVAPEEVTL